MLFKKNKIFKIFILKFTKISIITLKNYSQMQHCCKKEQPFSNKFVGNFYV